MKKYYSKMRPCTCEQTRNNLLPRQTQMRILKIHRHAPQARTITVLFRTNVAN